MISSIQVGQTHRIKAMITPDDIVRFVELSGDAAPLHTDGSFAKAMGFAGPLVHGAFLVALVSRLVGMEFPGPKALLERVDLAFRNPCYAPCEILLSATVKQISEAVATIILDIAIFDTKGIVLASGKTWHRILETEQFQ
jgi:3-hydroxybutyryl-CoA dehydratase